MQDQKPSAKNTKERKHIIGWIFGVLFLLSAFGMVFSSFLAGVFMLVAGLILLPPSRKWLEQKINKTLSRPLLFIIVFLLLIFAGIALPNTSSNTKQVKEKDKQQVADNNVEQTQEKQSQNKNSNQEKTPTETLENTKDAPVEEPKKPTMQDKLWTALDKGVGSRSGYDIQWDEDSGAVTLTKSEGAFWDENHLVRNTYSDLVRYGRETFKLEGISQVQVIYRTEFTDQYGKTEIETAVEIWFDKGEFEKYDWDNLSYLSSQTIHPQMQRSAAYYYLHPAVAKNLNEDKLYLSL